MKKLFLLAFLLVAACSSDPTSMPGPGSGSNPGSGSDMGSGSTQPEIQCFSGTPTTHDQIINACVDQSVTAIVKYPTLKDRVTALPLLHSDGSRPPLP